MTQTVMVPRLHPDYQQFEDVRHLLGAKYNALVNQGDAYNLAAELTGCLGVLVASVDDPNKMLETIYEGIMDMMDVVHGNPNDPVH